MKIGILTFHWATNYGAVLQAYALQEYLKQHGYDAEIINYVPYTGKKTIINCIKTKRFLSIPKNFLTYLKELKIDKFRKKYLNLSSRYSSFSELKANPPKYDVYICGSDQIWNPFFTLNGEKKITLSYFLDFGPAEVKRIAYAASFGCMKYPENLLNVVRPVLSKLNAVSVREKSGCNIVKSLGIDRVSVMPDPTLLLKVDNYEAVTQKIKIRPDNYFFYYVLHDSQKNIRLVKEYLLKNYYSNFFDVGSFTKSIIGVEQWLGLIQSSTISVTNSYHGMIFSIIFKKPFIIVPVEGRHDGMNDRIFTMLEKFGLQDCLLESAEDDEIEAILARTIDWDRVGTKLSLLRQDAQQFFEKSLSASQLTDD